MKKSLSRKSVAAIVSVAVAAAVICALVIINFFYPLKYFTAYIVLRKRSPEGELNLHILDVGQSDCAIAELPDGKTMLIDGGDGTYKNNLKILKELNGLDIDYIDYLICTSVNSEHCGGLAEIIKYKSVGTIFYPYCANSYITEEFGKFCEAAEASGAELVISEYGAGAESESMDFFFTFLSPSVHDNPYGEYAALNSSPSEKTMNDASAVMWIEYAGTGILYAGDVTSDVLDSIADNYLLLGDDNDAYGYFTYKGNKIDFSACAAIKVANHGSEESVCTRLIEILQPGIAVISVGKNNGEGCPSVKVMADLALFAEIFITQYAGDIKLRVDSDGVCSAQ